MRDEVERYGHYSLAAESMYDHPFQWGSKRTGPDLARVGGRYSDAWHVQHLADPQSVVPESIMPPYAFLDRPLDYRNIQDHLRAMRALGVPYTDEMVANARADLEAQRHSVDGDRDDVVTAQHQLVGKRRGGERGRPVLRGLRSACCGEQRDGDQQSHRQRTQSHAIPTLCGKRRS